MAQLPTRVCVFNTVATAQAPALPPQTGSNLIDIITAVDGSLVPSPGPSAAGVPVVLNPAGLIDPTLTHSGTVATADVGGVSSGNLVTLYIPTSGPYTGLLTMQPATASPTGTGIAAPAPPDGFPTPAIGFVTSLSLAGTTGTVNFAGTFIYNDPISEFDANSIGKLVYLADSGDGFHGIGAITLTPPSGLGTEKQSVGLVTDFNVGQVTVNFVPSFPGTSSGTVSFVALTAASTGFAVAGSPVTSSGTFVLSVTGATTGFVLTATSATTAGWAAPSAGGSPGSPSLSIQGNNAGTFAAIPGSTISFTSGAVSLAPTGTGVGLTITSDGATSNIQNWVSQFQGGIAVYIDTQGNLGLNFGLWDSIPSQGTAGQVLSSLGAGLGVKWITNSAGAGGSSGQVQGNSSGALAGIPNSSINFTTGATAIGTSVRVPTSTTGFTANGAGAHPIQDWYSSNEGFVVANLDYRGILFSQGAEINNTINFAEPALKVTGGGSGSPDIAQFITSVSSVPSATKTVFVDFNGNLNLAEGLKDHTGALGTSGQVLSTTGSQTLWVTPTAAAGGSPTQIQYNLAGALTGIAGSSVTTAGAVALAPTGTGVTLTVTGDAASSDLQDWVPNGGSKLAWFDHLPKLHITDVSGNSSLFGANQISMSGSGTDSVGIGGGLITVQATYTILSAAAIAAPQPALTVQGDQFSSNILNLEANDSTVVDQVDAFGSVIITPKTGGTNPAVKITGDGTNRALSVFDGVLGGNSIFAVLPSNSNAYAPSVFGQGSPASSDRQLEVTVNVTTDDTFAPSTVWNNALNVLQLTPTSPSSNNWSGSTISVTASGTQVFTGEVAGENIFVEGGSSGNINSLSGLEVSVQEAGSGGANQIVGISSSVAAITSVTTLIAGQFLVANNTPAVTTTATAIDIETPGFISGSTVTHAYGLHIENQETPLVAGNTDPWAIKVEGGTSGFTGVAVSINTQTGTYTPTRNDYSILCNGTFTLTLPTTGIKLGQLFRIKNIGVGTITVSSSVNIDFSTTLALSTQGQSVDVQWDGTQWWIF